MRKGRIARHVRRNSLSIMGVSVAARAAASRKGRSCGASWLLPRIMKDGAERGPAEGERTLLPGHAAKDGKSFARSQPRALRFRVLDRTPLPIAKR
ncbi:hypothetical protein [Shinella sp. HZN7]|uniref:hypothetical protein n=1 Tax=Shinella sp. (strain HZN7) TaxID=879274 RepID=UPI000B1738B6|nr:hypothetical protein [Shinella sp. HZN7]